MARKIPGKIPDELSIEIEEAQVALRDSLERAHELVCEAKATLRRPKPEASTPPIPTGPKPE